MRARGFRAEGKNQGNLREVVRGGEGRALGVEEEKRPNRGSPWDRHSQADAFGSKTPADLEG